MAETIRPTPLAYGIVSLSVFLSASKSCYFVNQTQCDVVIILAKVNCIDLGLLAILCDIFITH